MAYNQEMFEYHLFHVVAFVQHLAYARELKAAWDHVTDDQEFWASTVDGHLMLATIEWCKVFGKEKEDTHWTKTSSGSIDKEACEDFRRRVYANTGLDDVQWHDYQRRMLDARDKCM